MAKRKPDKQWRPEKPTDPVVEPPTQGNPTDMDRFLEWFALADHRSQGLREDMENEPWWRREASKLFYRTAEGNKAGASLPKQMANLAADAWTVKQKAVLTPFRALVRAIDRGFTGPAVTLAHNEALNWYRVMKEAQEEKKDLYPENPIYKKLEAKEQEARRNYEAYAEKEQLLLDADRDPAIQSKSNPYAGSALTRYLLTGLEELEDDPLLRYGLKGAHGAMTTPRLAGLSTGAQLIGRSVAAGGALTGAHQFGKAIDPSDRRRVDSANDIAKEWFFSSLLSVPFYWLSRGARAAAAREAYGDGGEPPPEGFRFPTAEEVKEKVLGLFRTDWPLFRRIFGAKSPEVATEMALKDLRKMEAKVNEKYFDGVPEQERATVAANDLKRAFKDASGEVSGTYGLDWEPEVPIENAPVNVADALAYTHPELSPRLSAKTFGEFAAKNPDVPQVKNTIALQESAENMRQKAVEAWRKFQATKAKLDAKLNPTDGSKPMSQEQYDKLLNQEWNRKWDGKQSLPEMLDALKREVGWTPRLPSEAGRPQLLNYSDLQNTDYGRRVTGLLKGAEAWDTAPREIRGYQTPYFLDVSASPNIGTISRGEQAMLEDTNPLATYLRTIDNLRKGARVGTDIGPSTYVGQQTARHIGGEGLMQAQEQQLAFGSAMADARNTLTKVRAKLRNMPPEQVGEYLTKHPEAWRAAEMLAGEAGYEDIIYQMRRAVLASEHPEALPQSFLWPKSEGIGLGEGKTFYGRTAEEIGGFYPEETIEGLPASERYSPLRYWKDAEGKLHPFESNPEEVQLSPENKQFLEETRLKSQIAEKEAELAEFEKSPVPFKQTMKKGGEWLFKKGAEAVAQSVAHGVPYWDDLNLEQEELAARAKTAQDKTRVNTQLPFGAKTHQETLRILEEKGKRRK